MNTITTNRLGLRPWLLCLLSLLAGQGMALAEPAEHSPAPAHTDVDMNYRLVTEVKPTVRPDAGSTADHSGE